MEFIKNLEFNYDKLCKLFFYGFYTEIEINFFDFSKASNPYIVSDNDIDISYDEEDNKYTISSTTVVPKIKLYLSNEGKYKINNNFPDAIKSFHIKNAVEIEDLDIFAAKMTIENSKIHFWGDGTFYVNDNVSIKNSNIGRIRYPLAQILIIENSNIGNLHGINSDAFSVSKIKNSQIRNINVNKLHSDIVETNIEDIAFRSGDITLQNCDIGKIISIEGDIDIYNCNLNDNINTKEGFIYYQFNKYVLKKKLPHNAIIKDKENNKNIKLKAKKFIPMMKPKTPIISE